MATLTGSPYVSIWRKNVKLGVKTFFPDKLGFNCYWKGLTINNRVVCCDDPVPNLHLGEILIQCIVANADKKDLTKKIMEPSFGFPFWIPGGAGYLKPKVLETIWPGLLKSSKKARELWRKRGIRGFAELIHRTI